MGTLDGYGCPQSADGRCDFNPPVMLSPESLFANPDYARHMEEVNEKLDKVLKLLEAQKERE